MKKNLRIICLVLLLLLLCVPAQAGINQFYLRTRLGQLLPYENLPFRYAIDVFEGFHMYSEEQLDLIWANAELDEDDDMVYDFRYWNSVDGVYLFQVQVKEQTYDSFETEVARAAQYAEIVAEDMAAAGYENLRQLHDGVIRSTPEGDMLEIAYSFSFKNNAEEDIHLTVVYYDCYYEDLEYVFEISAYNDDYDAAQYLLDAMIQTVRITPSKTIE